MLRSDEYAGIKADYDRISTEHFPKSYVPPPDMSFAKSDALFPSAGLRAAIAADFECSAAFCVSGPPPPGKRSRPGSQTSGACYDTPTHEYFPKRPRIDGQPRSVAAQRRIRIAGEHQPQTAGAFMNNELFERLLYLYEEECNTLDFKRDQYRFVKASDNEITGDRIWGCPDLAERVLNRLLARYGPDLVIVHGGATGVDQAFHVAAPGARYRCRTALGRLEGPGQHRGACTQPGDGRGRRGPVPCVASLARDQQGDEGLRSPGAGRGDSGLSDRG